MHCVMLLEDCTLNEIGQRLSINQSKAKQQLKFPNTCVHSVFEHCVQNIDNIDWQKVT